ncbi:TetR/AcrR family transcriptional regulator [Streptomyces asoensis]|uniref:TetR/AcrR family transcriptional regulator n=1 Tax=Streptomyces asoensis TaxID=249586 RepID=UPI0033C31050
MAGVGKGTLFRRFGDRNGLLLALLDDVEGEFHDAYTCGPPPLGPGAPAQDRLTAFGRALVERVADETDRWYGGRPVPRRPPRPDDDARRRHPRRRRSAGPPAGRAGLPPGHGRARQSPQSAASGAGISGTAAQPRGSRGNPSVATKVHAPSAPSVKYFSAPPRPGAAPARSRRHRPSA